MSPSEVGLNVLISRRLGGGTRQRWLTALLLYLLLEAFLVRVLLRTAII